MKKVKQIVIISGKGGTGKTTVTASLAPLIPQKIIVDTDVDAANLFLLLQPQRLQSNDFKGKPAAVIQPEICTACGLCRDLCRFDAIQEKGNGYRVDHFACEGCGLCRIACPAQAIEMQDRIVGQWFLSHTQWGDMVHARLIPGAENSGSLVAMVKQQAKEQAEAQNIDTILIDGPPGIGCPVIAAISGVSLAIIVTEPTFSGISDLQRVFKLATHFAIPCGIVINRFDINRDNSQKIRDFAHQKGIPILAEIPHLPCVMDAISAGQLPSKNCTSFATQIQKIYNKIKTI